MTCLQGFEHLSMHYQMATAPPSVLVRFHFYTSHQISLTTGLQNVKLRDSHISTVPRHQSSCTSGTYILLNNSEQKLSILGLFSWPGIVPGIINLLYYIMYCNGSVTSYYSSYRESSFSNQSNRAKNVTI